MSASGAKTRYAVAKRGEIAAGEHKIVSISAFGKEIEIGVFNVAGRLVAYRNVCPHAGAPVCQGKVCGTTLPGGVGEYLLGREGEILRCPWHGWEFDLLTGGHLVDERVKLRSYDVHTDEGGADDGRAETLDAFEVQTDEETIWLVL